MKRLKRTLAGSVLLLSLLIGLPGWLVARQIEQERKDQALIAALKAENTPKSLAMLDEGADGAACDRGEPPSFRKALQDLLERLWHRHPASGAPPKADDLRLPALLVLYSAHFMRHSRPDDQGPDLTLIRALLDHQAQVNVRDSEGRTPLWYATSYTDVEAARLILARGADPEAADTNGVTPLMDTNLGMTQLLLKQQGAQ